MAPFWADHLESRQMDCYCLILWHSRSGFRGGLAFTGGIMMARLGLAASWKVRLENACSLKPKLVLTIEICPGNLMLALKDIPVYIALSHLRAVGP